MDLRMVSTIMTLVSPSKMELMTLGLTEALLKLKPKVDLKLLLMLTWNLVPVHNSSTRSKNLKNMNLLKMINLLLCYRSIKLNFQLRQQLSYNLQLPSNSNPRVRSKICSMRSLALQLFQLSRRECQFKRSLDLQFLF